MVEALENKEPEEIQREIDETRDALSGKLEALESGVKVVVEDAKQSVERTVDDVKQAFDIRHQIGNHPWIALGLSFAAGVALSGPVKELISSQEEPQNGSAYRPSKPLLPENSVLLKAAQNFLSTWLLQTLTARNSSPPSRPESSNGQNPLGPMP